MIEYNKNLKILIDQTVHNFDAGEILVLIEFKTEYYNRIAKYDCIGEIIGPRLIEN